MDHFWAAISHWIDRIQPGNWSEWFGGIATAGSLFLGFYLISNDKRRQRESQPSRVSARMETIAKKVRVYVANRSESPVYNVEVHLFRRVVRLTPRLQRVLRRPRQFRPLLLTDDTSPRFQRTIRLEQVDGHPGGILQAGSLVEIESYIWDFPKDLEIYLQFEDDEGTKWCRDVQLRKFISMREFTKREPKWHEYKDMLNEIQKRRRNADR